METYLVMINNFKRSFRHKVLCLVTIGLPVALCLLSGLIDFGKPSLRVGLLFADGAQALDYKETELYQILDHSNGITYAVVDEAVMNTDLITGRFNIVLDYRNSLDEGGYQLISNQSEDKNKRIDSLIKTAMRKNSPIILSAMKSKGLSVTERSIALLLTVALILSTVHASSIIHDKHNGTQLRFCYSGNSTGAYISGTFFQILLITLLQVMIAMGVLTIFQKGFQVTLTEALLISGFISVIITTFSTLICLGSRSEMQSGITASSLSVLMALLGGTFVSVAAMPGLLRIISFVSPIRWIVELLRFL